MLLPEVIRKPVNDILREPLWKVLKEKAKPQSKHTYLSSCLRNNTYPKGVTPKVPSKIIDPLRELSVRWEEILHECGTSFTTVLDDHHKAEMALKAAKVIQDAMCELIPRYIVEFPNIKDILKGVVKEVKQDCALTSRRFERKRSFSNANKITTKKQKVFKSKTTTPVHIKR